MTSGGEPAVGAPRVLRDAPAGTGAALAALWLAVSREGGAVGFRPDAAEELVLAAAEHVVSEVRAGREQMIVIETGDELAGSAFLRRGSGPIVEHRADVLRLMVHPDLQGRGWGTRLLDAAVAEAGAMGLRELLLSARGGTPLPEFYAKQGWTEVGRWPRALCVGPGDWRDEHWFHRAV
ncbi:GNAT family N-acetyltransferase [Pseudonocardia sp. GCM10023141]|uniref:GNAT family N-acetyltransferase n=1 Tax=Pseudonocardia sp. GCM10023141 TaxID=3252653 RepID=UPI00361BD32A